ALGVGKKGAKEASPIKIANAMSQGDAATQDLRQRAFKNWLDAVDNYRHVGNEYAGRTGLDVGADAREGLQSLLQRNQEAWQKIQGYGQEAATFKAAVKAGNADAAAQAFQAAQAAKAASDGVTNPGISGLGAVLGLATGHGHIAAGLGIFKGA